MPHWRAGGNVVRQRFISDLADEAAGHLGAEVIAQDVGGGANESNRGNARVRRVTDRGHLQAFGEASGDFEIVGSDHFQFLCLVCVRAVADVRANAG